MALASVDGVVKGMGSGSKSTGKVVPPKQPVMIPSTSALDDATAYGLFGPGGSAGGATTQYAPGGGIINYALGRDPNGYYWVDDGTPEGYWYRPEDGAEWRGPSAQEQASTLRANASPFGGGPPVTNASVIKGQLQGIIDRSAAKSVGALPTPPVTDVQQHEYDAAYANAPKPEIWKPADMAAMDLAYSNAASASPQYTDADMAGLDLGFSNAIEAAGRSPDGYTAVSPYAMPEPRGGLSPWALPQYTNPQEQTRTLMTALNKDAPQGFVDNGDGTATLNGRPLTWVPPNPEGFSQQEREGYWSTGLGVPETRLNIKPRAGDGGLGLLADLTGSSVSDKRAQQVAGWITPGASLPGPVGDFAQDFGANLIQNIASPLGVAGFAFGGPVANFTGEVGGAALQTGGETAGLPAWATIPLAIAGGVAGGTAPGLGAGLRRSVDEALPPPSALAPSPAQAAPTPSIARQIDDILSPEGTRPEVGIAASGASPAPPSSGAFTRAAPEVPATRQAIPDSRPMSGGRYSPLAKVRLWFHSTGDLEYDVPNVELGAGAASGITQGPGIYLAADAAKSAGRYGPRTLAVEFDGTVLDLTAPADAALWARVEELIGERLGIPLRDVSKDRFAALARRTRSEMATPDNNYGYRDQIAETLRAALKDVPPEKRAPLTGRFGAVERGAVLDNNRLALATINNALADLGIDGLYHVSPHVDGEVLIVLNGAKARVVQDAAGAANPWLKTGTPVPTRTVPSGAAVASTKKPKGVVEAIVERKKGQTQLELRIEVDGADAGVIRRAKAGDAYEAFYRNPQGALVPVVKNAAGDPFTGTKIQARNAVANAYNARGRVLEDVPVKPRAPKVAAADEAVPPVTAAGEEAITPVPSTGTDALASAVPSPASFTTAKGSTYEISPDGTTTRNKAARPEHPGEVGPQPTSQRTWYVTGEDAAKLGEIQSTSPYKRIIAAAPDGRIGVKYVSGPSAGKWEARTMVSPQSAPAKGLAPVEVWKGGSVVHFGNEIVDIRSSAVPSPAAMPDAPRSIPGARDTTPKPMSNADKLREAARQAKSPAAVGETVIHNGQVYEVRGIQTARKTISLNNTDGTPVRGPNGGEMRIPWDQAQAVTMPPEAMTIRAMLNELGDAVPSDLRTRIYRSEAAWETAQRAGKELPPERAASVAAIRAQMERGVTELRNARMLDNPSVQSRADELVADLPKDIAAEGSPANVRAEEAALGRAAPEVQALHEAEVRGIQRAMAAEAPQPPGPMLGLVDATAAKNADGVAVRNRTRGQRAKDVSLQVAAAPFTGMRNLLLTGDMLVGRQLKSTLLTAPDVGLRGYRDQWRFLLSPGARRRMWTAVDEYRAANPHMDSILFRNGDRASLSEELYIGNLFAKGKYNPLRVLENANALALNAARISLDQKFGRAAVKAGVETPESMIARANFIGVLTGRGHGEFLDRWAKGLNHTAFISSRWTASRFQFWGLLLPPPVARSSIGRQFGLGSGEWYLWRQAMTRMTIGTGLAATAYMMLGQLPGVQIETNPLSSKFGSFNWRGRWYDFMGGLEEPFRLGARIWEGEGMSERGSRFSLEQFGRGPVSSRASAVAQYIEGRMPPISRYIAEQIGYTDPFINEDLPGGIPDWARRYIPLSAQQFAVMWNDVMNGDAAAFWALFDTVAIFHGEGVTDPSAMSQFEANLFADKDLLARLDKPEYKIYDDQPASPDNLSRAGWEYVKNNPDIFGAKPTSTMREFKETADKAAGMRAGVRSLQEDDDAQFESGEMSPDKWRTGRRARRAALGASLEALYGEFPAPDPNSDDVVERYFAAIEANKVGNDIDWEAVEDWEGRLSSAERKELNAYFDEKAKQGTAVEQKYTSAQDTLDAATVTYAGGEYGFFDLKNAVFETWKAGTPFEQYGSYDEWRQAEFSRLYEAALAETGSPSVAGEKARTEFSNLEGSSGFRDAYKNGALYNWVAGNPEAAKVAEEWGYYKPDEEARAIIQGGDAAPAQASQKKYEVQQKVEAVGGDWEAEGWRAWASQNLPAGAEYGSSSDYKSAAVTERVKAREAELGRALTPDEKGAIEGEVSDSYAAYSSTSTANAAASVRYVGSDGKWVTGRISQSGLAQVQAAKRIYDADPQAARDAWILGLPPFSSLSQAERAWLEQNGVVLE